MRPSRRILATVVATLCLVTGRESFAQSNSAFGLAQRAEGGRQIALLGITEAVSQAISALPPSGGQGFAYEFSPELQTFQRSSLLGPTAFRSPLTLRRGDFTARVAGSYFALSQSFLSAYEVSGLDAPVYTRFGIGVSARVGVLDVNANYGVLDWLQLSIDVPITIVDANATTSFVTLASALDAPIGDAPVAAATSIEALDQGLASGVLSARSSTFRAVGGDFNDGTSVGLGRIDLSAKARVATSDRVDVALALDLFLPSPSEAQFAGPSSTAILPRAIAAFKLLSAATLHVDVGYQYDTQLDELSAFVWNLGGSYALSSASVDLGVGGFKYDKGIQVAFPYTQPPGSEIDVPLQFRPIGGDDRLGTNQINFLFGSKLALTESLVLSGAVVVPINDEGIRPTAQGTMAIEAFF